MRPARPVDRPPYRIDPEALARFDQRRTAFSLLEYEPPPGGESHATAEPTADEAACDIVARIARHVHNRFAEVLGDLPDTPRPPAADRPSDPAANAELVRAAARSFGADLVGICRVNPLWLYARDARGRAVELPAGCRYAVVLATAMDADALRRSAAAANAETHLGYMRMAVQAACVARLLVELGYVAVACRNDTALSIPLAVDAGLGEMGRCGCLLTERFGPAVRLSKVFTDMPLAPDRPVDLGVAATCRNCRLCAAACPVGAVSDASEPSWRTDCPASNPGVLRYGIDALACLRYWRQSGRSCSACIAACPLTR